MTAEQSVQKFRMDMLRKMPFYGGVVMRLRFRKTTETKTACTNGYEVLYNGSFITGMSEPERYYVLLHEVFHVMLGHCRRDAGRDPQLWNIACDMLVNGMIDEVTPAFKQAGVLLKQPKNGVYGNVSKGETVENIYARLKDQGGEDAEDDSGIRQVFIAANDLPEKPPRDEAELDRIAHAQGIFKDVLAKLTAEDSSGESAEGVRNASSARGPGAKGRSAFGHLAVPSAMLGLTQSRRLDWRRLLRNMLEAEQTDETSYQTPERKYLHMDLLVPGYGTKEETLNNVWLFIDSSGSVEKRDLEQFLTQAARIGREFSCPLNIAYWDTRVSDVYRNVLGEKNVLKCQPHHSGGTDINCIYRWMRENRVKPDTMIILTDGYFGGIREAVPWSLIRKTVLVITEDGKSIDSLPDIGRYARL